MSLLQQTDFVDNTLIIFSADHGEACGSHQLFQKFALYEESVRVPLIVSCLGEGIELQRDCFDNTHFVSGVDLLPTVCDYANVEPPTDSQGDSLRPLVEGKEVTWKDYVYIESNYWGRAIVTDQYKYITEYKPKSYEDYLPPGPNDAQLGLTQLFHRNTDPSETKNLADEPECKDIINACKIKLFSQEKRLNRRQIVQPRPQSVISNWGKRLQGYWEHGF